MEKLPLFRIIAIILGISLIGLGCLMILHPFLPAMLLALIFCLATWPAFSIIEKKVGGRSWLAALIMTTLLFLGFLLPLAFLGSSLADSVMQLVKYISETFNEGHGQAPEWVSRLPDWLQGYVRDFWANYLKSGQQVMDGLTKHAAPLSQYVLYIGTKIGHGFIDLSLGLFISFFFFSYGAQSMKRVGILLERFIGDRGLYLLQITKDTLISVIYGVLGTALAQGALAGIGFWIASVPGATFFGFVTVLMSLIPAGPPFVWIPINIWIFMEGHIGMGIFMSIWGFFVISGADNVLRPYFISLGSDLPLLLVLLGVLGGLLAFGFIGLFIGPTLLALAYTLVLEWSHEEERRLEPEA